MSPDVQVHTGVEARLGDRYCVADYAEKLVTLERWTEDG